MAARFSPIIIGSERSEAGIPAAMEILRSGGSALDAVERGLRLCEDNLSDHYVGTGGLPNARGVVELDASIMWDLPGLLVPLPRSRTTQIQFRLREK